MFFSSFLLSSIIISFFLFSSIISLVLLILLFASKLFISLLILFSFIILLFSFSFSNPFSFISLLSSFISWESTFPISSILSPFSSSSSINSSFSSSLLSSSLNFSFILFIGIWSKCRMQSCLVFFLSFPNDSINWSQLLSFFNPSNNFLSSSSVHFCSFNLFIIFSFNFSFENKLYILDNSKFSLFKLFGKGIF